MNRFEFNTELLILKAQVHALKLLLPPCLSLLADQFDDREKFLRDLETRTIAAIQAAAPRYSRSETNQSVFVQMASDVASTALQAARLSDTAPAPRLQ
jgi:hypothetical protein